MLIYQIRKDNSYNLIQWSVISEGSVIKVQKISFKNNITVDN